MAVVTYFIVVSYMKYDEVLCRNGVICRVATAFYQESVYKTLIKGKLAQTTALPVIEV